MGILAAALVLSSLYSSSTNASPDCSPTPTTYALITPSPSAAPYPVTEQGQVITSHVPQYAVCNPDNSDCTTIYQPTTYAWCSAVVPCYPHSCTVTDCGQAVTFSHENSYQLATTVCPSAGEYTVHGTPTHVAEPTTLWYVEPVTTKYVLPYAAYAAGNYDDVVVERCVDVAGDGTVVCEVGVEHWVEEVTVTEEVTVLPVTVHTYCAEPTTVVWGEGSVVVVVDEPTTVTWVTGVTSTSTLTSTVTVVAESSTPCETTPGYTSPEYTVTATVSTDCPSSTVDALPTVAYPTPADPSYAGAPYYSEAASPYYSEAASPYYSEAPSPYYSEAPSPYYSEAPSPYHSEAPYYSEVPYSALPTEAAHHTEAPYSTYTPQRRDHNDPPRYYPASPYRPADYYTKGASAAYSAEHESSQSGQAHRYGEYADASRQDEASRSGAASSTEYVKRDEYEYSGSAAGAGKADGQAHSYGQYKDYKKEYEYSASAAGSGYRKSEPAIAVYDDYNKLDERDESVAYGYATAGAGKASGQAHSYGQYADYSKGYEYSTAGKGEAYRDEYDAYAPEAYKADAWKSDEYESGDYEPVVKKPVEYKPADYKPVESKPADYKPIESKPADYKPVESKPTDYEPIERKPDTYTVEKQIQPRDESIAYSYDASGAGKSNGQAHSYGQYKDHADAYKYRASGAGSAYRATDKYPKEAYVDGDLEKRDHASEYYYKAAGAGNKSGEKHSYGQYADYAAAYKHRESGSGAEYSKYDEPVVAVYAKEAYVDGDLEKRDHASEYYYKAAGAGNKSGEKHSYGQYADYAAAYKHRESGAGAEYSDSKYDVPIAVYAEVEERDEFSASASRGGSGRKSGEVHSYGQYADYSDSYEYDQAKSASAEKEEEGPYGGYPASIEAKSKESGEFGRKAAGERHSYGQYQDYEMEVKHEYENEASVKAAQRWGDYGQEKGKYEKEEKYEEKYD